MMVNKYMSQWWKGVMRNWSLEAAGVFIARLRYNKELYKMVTVWWGVSAYVYR